MTRHSKTFPARTDQVGQARRFLAGLLGDRDGATGAITCMSELAANACLHSVSSRPGGTFTVHVLISEDDLRIEVSDEGGPWKPGDGEDEWPHGLAIVAALATESGVTGDEKGGRTAWATFCHAGANRE